MEIWKEIKGWSGYYEVSNFGNVRRPANSLNRYKTERRLKSSPCKGNIGYLRVCLKATIGGSKIQKDVHVHALVCEAFHGDRPIGFFVRHKDGNHLNNYADNLTWGTRQDNEADKVAHGTSNVGRVRVRHNDGTYKRLSEYRI